MTINTDKLGWLAAAALAGAMATGALSGYQANTAPKFATVDMGKVFDDSALAATNSETLENARKARAGTLDFIARNRAMDPNDAKKYADLTLKAAPSPTDKTETDRLRTAAEAATQKRSELATKATTTDAEKTQIAAFGSNATANNALLQNLQQQYEGELQTMSTDLREKTLDRVRDVVKNLAAKQGYSVVFSTSAAPYAANDLTADAEKALKK